MGILAEAIKSNESLCPYYSGISKTEVILFDPNPWLPATHRTWTFWPVDLAVKKAESVKFLAVELSQNQDPSSESVTYTTPSDHPGEPFAPTPMNLTLDSQ
jgi:hypothetical protein